MKLSTLLAMAVGAVLAATVPRAFAQSQVGPTDQTAQSGVWQNQHDWRDRDGRDHQDHPGPWDRPNWRDPRGWQGDHDRGDHADQHPGQHAGSAETAAQRQAIANADRTIAADQSRIRSDDQAIRQGRAELRTDFRDLHRDYAERRDGAHDQQAIAEARADIRTEVKDIHQDETNLRSTEQNLRTERQDLRRDPNALRRDRGDLRYANADLRNDQAFRVGDDRDRDRDGDRAWRPRGGSEALQPMTAATVASNAAANEKKSAATQQLQRGWYRYAW